LRRRYHIITTCANGTLLRLWVPGYGGDIAAEFNAVMQLAKAANCNCEVSEAP